MFDIKEYAKIYMLFIFHEMCAGQVSFLPKGKTMMSKMYNMAHHLYKNVFHYSEVSSFSIARSDYWNLTGHMSKYKSNMFKIDEEKDMYLKPMNCPMHMILAEHIYKIQQKTPIKIYEFNYCFRNENSGSLYSLFRLIRFTQDDVHIIESLDNIPNYLDLFIKHVKSTYSKFNLNNIKVRFSKTDVDYIGNIDQKNKSEFIIKNFLCKNNIDYIDSVEGAFYGPKIDIIVIDRLNRNWQVGTIQIDLCTLERIRFPLLNNDNYQNTILIHQAIFGTFERFLGVVIEHNQGVPECITPFLCKFIGITNKEEIMNYINNIYEEIIDNIDDISIDYSNEHLNNKIKKNFHYEYLCIIGEKEVKNNEINIYHTKQNKKYSLSKKEFIIFIKDKKKYKC
ncbi:Threonine--tRNA ligase [bacterium AB1]|nr:Threonine--tRNA ligase [bacterium AB1]